MMGFHSPGSEVVSYFYCFCSIGKLLYLVAYKFGYNKLVLRVVASTSTVGRNFGKCATRLQSLKRAANKFSLGLRATHCLKLGAKTTPSEPTQRHLVSNTTLLAVWFARGATLRHRFQLNAHATNIPRIGGKDSAESQSIN